MNAPKLVVTVIGNTVVGRGIGTALRAAGHNVLSVADSVEHVQQADLVVLAMDSVELPAVVTAFTENNVWRPGQLVAHTCGEYGFGILSPAVSAGIVPMAIHPSMRFTETEADEVAIRESYFAISAPEIALPVAQALVIEMGAEPLEISEANRKIYFEAWSVANDFSGLVVNQAIGLLEQIGVRDARGVIGPVVRASVEQALADGHRSIDDIGSLADEEPRENRGEAPF